MHPATKNKQQVDPTEADILQRLRQMIGDPDVSIKILSTFQWNINDQVAETYQRGRVLCIGDAVHRHPPINGLGSNTCIADAFNLAWKLAYVLQDVAGPALLDTLTVERKPVGDGVVRRANAGMEAHRTLWALLGLTPEDRARAVAQLERVDDEGARARRRLQDALEATDAELQALGMQMNQIYVGSSATVAAPDDVAPDLGGCDLLKEVVLSTYPGYHLPHVWLAADGQSPRVSSLDVVGHGGFTLFTGVGGQCWIEAAKTLAGEAGLPEIRGHSIGFRCGYMDCYRDWRRVRGVKDDGVVLVRPDHFVAWRYATSSCDATAMLRRALQTILKK